MNERGKKEKIILFETALLKEKTTEYMLVSPNQIRIQKKKKIKKVKGDNNVVE